jgi:hypothetical protein
MEQNINDRWIRDAISIAAASSAAWVWLRTRSVLAMSMASPTDSSKGTEVTHTARAIWPW